MGKKISVKIINQTKLELLEDAKSGDIIDLNDVMEIDNNFINALIEEKRLEELDRRIKENERVVRDSLAKDYEIQLGKKEKSLDEYYKKEIKQKDEELSKLKTEFEILKNQQKSELEKIEANLEKEHIKILSEKEKDFDKEKIELEKKIENLEINAKNTLELEVLKKGNELKAEFDKKIEEINKEKQAIIEEKDKLKEENDRLNLKKSLLNVKKIGEELETWCNDAYAEAANAGFDNATWHKDNTSIKEEGEEKGTKADYIFRVYASDAKKEDELLTSVCLEMKNESNTSTNKKKNSDHYEKLDKDRIKKNCEYGILVSELEWVNDNDVPIRRCPGYKNLYMCRPQYMMTLLSMLYNITLKFKDLKLERIKEEFNFKSSQEIIDEFERFKKTYLDDPLASLEKKVDELAKNNEAIRAANEKNINLVAEMKGKTIQTIKEKIERFDIKKIGRKIDKLED